MTRAKPAPIDPSAPIAWTPDPGMSRSALGPTRGFAYPVLGGWSWGVRRGDSGPILEAGTRPTRDGAIERAEGVMRREARP